MIFRCTSCQNELPAQLPPHPMRPSVCGKCGGQAFAEIHDTDPPPAPVEPDPDPALDGESDTKPPRNGKRPKLLISTMVYGLSKELGPEDAVRELNRQIEELQGPFSKPLNRHDYLPVAFTIARATRVFDVGLYVDAGATQIGKARSRAFAHAMKNSDFEVWLSVDDDVECTLETLVGLYDAVSGGAPSIAIGPCWLRGVARVNVALPKVVVDRTLVGSGAKLRTALYGGFGLVAMSQEAITRIAGEASCPWFVDDDDVEKPAPFLDRFEGKRWFGEDFSFFSRVPVSVRVEALLTGATRHAEETLRLDRLDQAELLTVPQEWDLMRQAKDLTARSVRDVEPPPVEPAPALEHVELSEPRVPAQLDADDDLAVVVD